MLQADTVGAKGDSPIYVAAGRLRALSLAAAAGDFLAGEDALVSSLGVSRSTLRQSARLLEREGFLRVRRGINGGYFAARPDERTIEAAVSAYLDTLDMETSDITAVATALWIEAVRRAAQQPPKLTKVFVADLLDRIDAVGDDASFEDILGIERDCQRALFSMTRARYIELIFHINIAFSRRRFVPNSARDDTEAHRAFVKDWRRSKHLEIAAIGDGDVEGAAIAARHARNIWNKRIWSGQVR